MVPLFKKFQKWRLTRFAIKTLHISYYQINLQVGEWGEVPKDSLRDGRDVVTMERPEGEQRGRKNTRHVFMAETYHIVCNFWGLLKSKSHSPEMGQNRKYVFSTIICILCSTFMISNENVTNSKSPLWINVQLL